MTPFRVPSYRDGVMEILSGEQMRRVDARAVGERGIPSLDLMESAGLGVAVALTEEVPGLGGRRVLVVCGKGNNGGDGLVAARHLAGLGVTVRVLVLAAGSDLRGDAATQLSRARAAGLGIEEIPDERAWTGVGLDLGPADLVLDALLGTGISGGARGLVARAIEDISGSGATVASIDLPSGADADSGRLEGPVVRAHRTYTLCRPKPCLVLEPCASHAGSWRVIDIGIPDDLIASERASLEWLDAATARALLPARPQDAHKGTMGHLLAVAGSRGKTGAATLLAGAALRCGVGLVTVATPRSVQPLVAAARAEVMTEPLPERVGGTLSRSATGPARRLLEARDALAVGPGLGAHADTRAAIQGLVLRCPVPCVLDADGLNAFAAGRRDRARLAAGSAALVLTPHPGEAARLLATSAAAIVDDRLGSARALAAQTGAIVVLKGRRSIAALPDGSCAFNASGNPGMATGGTGDALTGVIGALLARGMGAFDAARLGMYVHGAAGDRAAARLGEDGMIAGDLVDELPGVWRALRDASWGVERWTPGA